MKRREISPEELKELEEFEKAVTGKSVYRRLQCILLRVRNGWKREQIAEATGYHWRHVERVQQEYFDNGMLAFERKKREKTSRQYLSAAEEAEFLHSLEAESEAGRITSGKIVQLKLTERIKHPVALSTVYAFLHRNGWSLKRPRPKHPQGSVEAQQLFKKIP